MTYIFLIVFFLCTLIFCYVYFKKDILSPSVLSSFFFLVAFILAYIGTFYWNTEKELSLLLVCIFCFGIISFIVGSIFAKKLIKQVNNKKETTNSRIELKPIKIILSSLFIVLTIILLIFEIKRVCASYGFQSNSIPKLLEFYRSQGVLYDNSLNNSTDISFIVKQMHKICLVIGVTFIYIYAKNFYHTNKSKLSNLLLIPIILCMLESLLTSGRSTLMKTSMTFVFLMVFFYMKKHKNNTNYLKLALSIIVVLGIFALSFYYILPLTGRGTSRSLIEYLTFYFSTGIPSFNVFLKNLPQHSLLIGEETFTGIYLLLNKLNIVDFTRITEYGWVSFNGMDSNIYTSLRAYFFDFSFIGVIILQFIFGFLISYYYFKIKNKNNDFSILIYGYYSYIFIEQIRAEQFFCLISTTTISYILFFMIIYTILIDKNYIKKSFNNIKEFLINIRHSKKA